MAELRDPDLTTASPELQLWQTEWCPSSHRVRQRLTELGLSYLIRQVPAGKDDRAELVSATGGDTIPVLVADGVPIPGEEAITDWLNTNCPELPGAGEHRRKAAKAKRKELEEACQKL